LAKVVVLATFLGNVHLANTSHRRVHVSIVIDRFGDGLIVPSTAIYEESGPFKGPGDDIETGFFGLLGIDGWNDLAVVIGLKQHLHGWGDDIDVFVDQLFHGGRPGIGFGEKFASFFI
jgi:hypothetical protein